MIVEYTVLKNHSVKSGHRLLGTKGDHLTNILNVSLFNCGFDFEKAEIRFVLPKGSGESVVKLPVDKETQIVTYPMPYKLFLNSGVVRITVTATTTDGEAFSSLSAEYIVSNNDLRTEDIQAQYESAVLGEAKLNTMILGLG